MNNLPVVRSPWRIVILLLGFTFLYAPMLMLVIYSFNSSKLVTAVSYTHLTLPTNSLV